MPPILP
jgi:hypothetical protein